MMENMPADRIFRFGEFELMADDRMLLRNGGRVAATPRVIHLLTVLVEKAGRVVTKETLMKEVWADTFVEEGNLNQTISRLRKILGETPDENRFIETIPRVGYRFIASVELAQRQVGGPDSLQTKAGLTSKKKYFAFRYLAVSLIVLVIALGAFSIWRFRSRSETVAPQTPPKQTPKRLTQNPTREDRPTFTSDGRIRFVRWVNNLPTTFIMEADGSNQRPDTSIAGLETGLWSPDGRKVVFSKMGDESGSVYLANADGSGERRLPFIFGNNGWAPDGRQFIYQAGRPNSDIFLYTLETGQSITLASGPSFEADPLISPDGKSFVFVSDRDGNPEIYIQDLDRSSPPRRLTDHPAHDEFPTFSPDGTQIVFNSNREDENFDVYIMNTDGSGVKRLTNWKTNEEIRPGCWSADGTQIVFLSHQDGKPNVYIMDVEPFAPKEFLKADDHDLLSPTFSPDGKKLLYVSGFADKSGELRSVDLETNADMVLLKLESSDAFPRYSPDGRQIIFQNRIGGNAEICLVAAKGGQIQNLTNNPARDVDAAWSPDGSRIVFSSNRGGNFDVFSLFVINADGSNLHQIYYNSAISAHPSWSPDGRQIVFANDKVDNRTGNFEIFSITPETVNPETRLTSRRGYDMQPVFSPDGGRIAFSSNADGNMEIYMMRADGSYPVRLTRDPAYDSNPSWSPDGNRIIFNSNRNGKFAIFELALE